MCSPLKNSIGKLRLVLNLCYLNQYLWLDKYEDIRTAMLMLQKENYMFSFDLKHHVDIYTSHIGTTRASAGQCMD